MIVSRKLKYVYIGIPRTGSKSMNEWLMANFEGEWLGHHHQWQIPEEFRDYLVFATVRNPYEREVSAWFFQSRIDEPRPIPSKSQFAEGMRDTILLKDGRVKIETQNVPEVRMNQKHFVEKAGASLILHFEELPDCLRELPFVNESNMPAFPLVEEAGSRPPGNFFDHFTMEDEALVWEYASEDFELFGYRRFDCGFPGVKSSTAG